VNIRNGIVLKEEPLKKDGIFGALTMTFGGKEIVVELASDRMALGSRTLSAVWAD